MFHFGTRSMNAISSVHHMLARVLHGALKRSTYDFGITEGLRTPTQQLQRYTDKASPLNGIRKGDTVDGVKGTGMSMHQFRLALDVVAYVEGEYTYEMDYYVAIAEAVRLEAIRLGVRVVWGGCWDMALNDMDNVRASMHRYQRKIIALGKVPFVDGCHFQHDRRAA